MRILGQGEGCGGIVADGKQAREQRRGAVVRGVTLQPTQGSMAVRYRVTRAAGLALDKKKEKRAAVACELGRATNTGSEIREGKPLAH